MAANETSESSVASPVPDGSSRSMVVLKDSSFFSEHRGSSLPTPEEVRALCSLSNGRDPAEDWNPGFGLTRPAPITIPSLGLFIKYGREVTVAEAKTQDMIYRRLRDRVPTPEIFGWAQDGEQVFIYMALIEGDSLQNRWSAMEENERISVCRDLKPIVAGWRNLAQTDEEDYIGTVERMPLNEIFIFDRPELKGPYLGPNAVQHFHEVCDIEISNDTPIVFTHNDFCPPNILLTPGKNPRVAAIVDWGQAGWLPAYWESCKARRVSAPGDELSPEEQEEWWTKYLPMIMEFVDDEVYHPFIYFQLAKM